MMAEWQRAVVEERAEDSARGVVAWMVADVAPAGYQEQRPMKGLCKSRPDTLWVNAAGLAAAVDAPQWQRLVLKSPALLIAPPATTRGAMEALVDFLGRETAMDRIRRNPGLLRVPGIVEMLEALHCVFSEEDVRSMVKQSPAVLMAKVATVESALAALREYYGGDDAAVLAMVLQSPSVLMAPGIAEMVQVLRAAFSEEDVQAMVVRSPTVLTAPAATVKRALAALREFCGGDDAAVLAMVLQTPSVLRAPGIAETLEVLRAAFSEEDIRAMVEQSPAVLREHVATVKRALAALREYCGGDDAAVLAMVRQSPNVLGAPGIAETLEVLRDAFSEEDIRAMVKQSPEVLTAPAATVERHLTQLRTRLPDTPAVRRAVLRDPQVLRGKDRLERALRRWLAP
jgi:arsenate reductase-like glutaredoxin family protein